MTLATRTGASAAARMPCRGLGGTQPTLVRRRRHVPPIDDCFKDAQWNGALDGHAVDEKPGCPGETEAASLFLVSAHHCLDRVAFGVAQRGARERVVGERPTRRLREKRRPVSVQHLLMLEQI